MSSRAPDSNPVDGYYCPDTNGPWILSLCSHNTISSWSWTVATKEEAKACIPLICDILMRFPYTTSDKQLQLLQDMRAYRSPEQIAAMRKRCNIDPSVKLQFTNYTANGGDFKKVFIGYFNEMVDMRWKQSVGDIFNRNVENDDGTIEKMIDFAITLVAPPKENPLKRKAPVEHSKAPSAKKRN